jgi:SEC-C motif-containing protein
MSSLEIICPCGRNNKLYKDCCMLIHTNILNALTAEDLMRSRYSAFVLCNGDYLLSSHSIQYRDLSNIHNTIRWSRSVAWNRLEIISTLHGLENDLEGTVEFKAFFKEKNKIKCIHENSLFIRENLHWVYLDAL